MEDFILDTDGHNCFLCSEYCPPNERQSVSDSLSSTTYSIQCLSRYLKMDMRKVFNEEGPIALQLLTKVEKAKLKVELCAECTSLNEVFSNLYRKMEKLDLEVKSCLSLIQKKFMKGTIKETTKSNGKDEFDGRTQIVVNLRNDGMEKCDAKLRKVSPRLRIQRMTTKQVDKERSRIKNKFARQNKFAVSIEKVEHTSDVMANHNNEDMDYSDDMGTDAFEHLKSDAEHIDAEEGHPIVVGTKQVKEENEEIASVLNSTKSVGPFSKSAPEVEGKKCTLNKLTGKYKCVLCPKEFSQPSGSFHHYNSVHLKAKFKCKLCGKEFTHKSSFKRHHQGSHMGT